MPVRLSGKEIVKALAKDGWLIERVSGSHHVMGHTDGRHISVPVHGNRPLPPERSPPSAALPAAPPSNCAT